MSARDGGGSHGGGPSATSTVLRRLRDGTPPKNNSLGAGASTSAASGAAASSSSPKKAIIVNGCELPPGVPDLSKLTNEQRLNMLQRIMKNDYKPGAGMSQFLSSSSSNSDNSKGNAVKNLNQAFDCDSSTLSVIKGSGGNNRRFVETLTAEDDDDPEVLVDKDRPTEEGESDDDDDTLLSDRYQEKKDEKDNLPEICRLVDEFVEVHDHYKIFLERANEAVVEKNFADVFPEERVVSLFRDIDGFMTSLEAFNTQSPAENMKIFYSTESKRSSKKAISCPVEKQKELLAMMYQLSSILSKIDKKMKSDEWKNMEATLEDKMQLYRKTVDKMERDLKDLEKRQKSITESYSLLSSFANHNTSGSSGSGDMLDLDNMLK